MFRSIIVTGANAGMGFETAKDLARNRSTQVVVACRDAGLGKDAVEQIKASGGNAVFLRLDLSIQKSIHTFVESFRAAGLAPLAAIICNAGMQNVGTPQTTIEGYETTFAVNHLGHYLLVRLLLYDLKRGGRIVFVSSGTHDPKEKTGMPAPVYKDAFTVAHDLEDANRPAGLRRYTTSKLCNVLCTYELSRRLKASDDLRLRSIEVNAIDPGLMPATGLARSWPKPLRWVSRNILPFLRLINSNVHTPQVSGARVAALATETASAPGGRYFSNGKPVQSSDLSYEEALQKELWVSSAEMSGLPIGLAPTSLS